MKELYFSNADSAKEVGLNKANSLCELFKLQFCDYDFFQKSVIQFRTKEGYKERYQFNEIDIEEVYLLYISIEEQVQVMEQNLEAVPLGEEIFLGDYSYQGFANPLDRPYTNEELNELEGLRLTNLIKKIKSEGRNHDGIIAFELTKEAIAPYVVLGLIEVTTENNGENLTYRYFRSEKTSLEIIAKMQEKFAKQYKEMYFKSKQKNEEDVFF